MAHSSQQEELIIGGTGSSLGFMRHLANSYRENNPEFRFTVLPSLGSTGGIRALKSSVVNLAVSSRKLKDTEKSGLRERLIGKSPFIFVVHPSVDIEDINLAQIADIYSSKLTKWSDGSRIRPIVRPENDTDWKIMQNSSSELENALELAAKREGLFLAVTDTDAVSYLEQIPGSFGPTTLAMILAEKRRVNILSLNGIPPTRPTDSTINKYPLEKNFFLISKETPSSLTKDFLKFIESADGKKILQDIGIYQTPH